jgi:hypothetical protein
MTIDDRVAAGASWLDANRPGWWQRINLDTLDLGDPCNCVLGQEYGQYHDAPHEIRIGSNPTGAYAAVEHGFNFNPFDPIDVHALTVAWRTLIQTRRDADTAVWPGRTHDGRGMRDTETADVAGEVL